MGIQKVESTVAAFIMQQAHETQRADFPDPSQQRKTHRCAKLVHSPENRRVRGKLGGSPSQAVRELHDMPWREDCHGELGGSIVSWRMKNHSAASLHCSATVAPGWGGCRAWQESKMICLNTLFPFGY